MTNQILQAYSKCHMVRKTLLLTCLGIELKWRRVLYLSEDLRVDCITKESDNQLILQHILHTELHLYRVTSKLSTLQRTSKSWTLPQRIPVLWSTCCYTPNLNYMSPFNLPTTLVFILQIPQELITLYSLPEVKTSFLPYDDPGQISQPPRF